jgi:hypothetical protein
VFELLKIGDPQQMIPDAVHSGLTVNAEKLLFAIKDMFLRVDEFYAPKKKVVPTATAAAASGASGTASTANTPGVPRIFVSTPSQSRMPMSMSFKNQDLSPLTKQGSKSAIGPRALASNMPRLTPSLSRIEPKPASKEEEDNVFSLLDEDFN